MGSGHFKLDGQDVIEVDDVLVWAAWYEKAERAVAKTTVGAGRVSTVFLGLDHRHGGVGPPLVFETMVFGGPLDNECERYATWAEAEAGHNAIVRRCVELAL